MAEPYAHSKIKFDIQNLAATWSSEQFNSIMTKIDIKVDPAQLIERNITKEQLMAQVYTDVALSDRTYEFTKPSDSTKQPEDLQKELVLKSKIAFLTRAAIFKRLEKEALETFLRIQHARALHAALRDYIRKLSAENYQKFLYLAEDERMKMEEKMNALIMAELERLNKEALQHWHQLQAEIDRLDESIVKLRKQREDILAEYRPQIIAAGNRFRINGIDPFESLGELRNQFYVDLAVDYQNRQQRIEQDEYSLNNINDKLEEAYKIIRDRQSELQNEHAPAIASASTLFSRQKELSKIYGQDTKINETNAHVNNLKAQHAAKQSSLTDNTKYINESMVENNLIKFIGQLAANNISVNFQGINKDYIGAMKNEPGVSGYQKKVADVDRRILQAEAKIGDLVKNQSNVVTHNTELNNNARNSFRIKPASNVFDKLKQRTNQARP